MVKRWGTVLGTLMVVILFCAYYEIDNVRVGSRVGFFIRSDLKTSLAGLVQSSLSSLSYFVPPSDKSNLYVTPHNVDTGAVFRVVNVKDQWIQKSVEDSVLEILNTNPLAPVCKIRSVTLDFGPLFNTAEASADVEYFGPLGHLKSTTLSVSCPLPHLRQST